MSKGPLHPKTLCVVLAGGQARRMGGGDKCLLPLGGEPILSRLVRALSNQVDEIVLNANGDTERFSFYGLEVVSDPVNVGACGPLSGILAGLKAADDRGYSHLLSVPGDCPFLPKDLASRLFDAQGGQRGRIAHACSGGRDHPVIALWPVDLKVPLEDHLLAGGDFAVKKWIAQFETICVDWSHEPIDPFFNINAPEDLKEIEESL